MLISSALAGVAGGGWDTVPRWKEARGVQRSVRSLERIEGCKEEGNDVSSMSGVGKASSSGIALQQARLSMKNSFLKARAPR